MSATEVRSVLVVDVGPVTDAAIILAGQSTLSEHVTITRGEWTSEIAMYGPIPFELWGSGTQALWRLLSAIAYTGETVSLYEVAARCDNHNRVVAGRALARLFGISA